MRIFGGKDINSIKGGSMQEDNLLLQIDSFREKAKKLQTLMDERRERVNELEVLLKEKEEKNIALQDELDSKSKVAEEILEQIKSHFVDMNSNLDETINRMETNVTNSINDNSSFVELKDDLSEKIHSENVRMYRNVQDFIKQEDKSQELFSRIEKKTEDAKGWAIAAFFFSIINTALLVSVLLLMFGII